MKLMALGFWLIINQAQAGSITIHGKVELPVLHLKNLLSLALQANGSLDQQQFAGAAGQAHLDFNFAGHKESLDHYPLLETFTFPYAQFMQVRAVALPGPHREQKDFATF